MKIGILSFAHLHADSYAYWLTKIPEMQLMGIFDDNRERGEEKARKFQTQFIPQIERLLDRVEAVIICTENNRHREFTEVSAQAGKHVLCEKPIATTLEDAQAMIDVCEKNRVKLMIAFPCRFHPVSQHTKKLLGDNVVGEILSIKGTNRGMMPGDWFTDPRLSGGGAIIDHTVHVVDLIRWMLKQEVAKVYAEIDNLIFPDLGIDDCGTLVFTLENGIFATLDPSWSRPLRSYPTWGDVTLELIGTRGVIQVDLYAQNLNLYCEKESKASWINWGSNADREMLREYKRCVVENLPSPVTGYDGLKALEVALAAYRSAKAKKPVSLPL